MTGREYETRNYGFEEVHHAMAERLAVVSKCDSIKKKVIGSWLA